MSAVKWIIVLLFTEFNAGVLGKDPWWLKIAKKQGPMVCAEEYVQGSDRYFATPWTGGNLCGSETIIRYSCCHGYRTVPGERGCPLVQPLKNLVETAQDIGAKKFIQHVEQTGLLPLLSDGGAYTLFIAPDSAFLSLSKEQEKALNNSKRSRNRPPVLLYNVAEGRIPAEDLPNFLSTLYREGSVFVTRLPNQLTAVNCIPLITTNIEATNGLIHVTESLLSPTGRTTIPDLIVRTPTLSTTSSAIVRAQLANELRDKRPITIFAPTDEAWGSLPTNFVEALMEDPSSLKVLLQYHVIEDIWCPAISAGITELKTLEKSMVTISCNSSGQYVNGARIIHSDHKAGNGLIHHIDAVLIPEKVYSLVEYMKLRRFKYFLKLAEVADLLSLLQRQDLYTVFAPEDDIFEGMPNETLSDLLNQSSLARDLISFHLVPGRHLTNNIIDGKKFSPYASSGIQLRLKLHKKRLTVESAFVKESDLETRNGVVHIVDRILTPPSLSVLEILQEGNFSIFMKLLNGTEPNLLKLLENSSTITVFAPCDKALNGIVPGMVPRLLADPPLLYKTMAHHILSAFVVTNSLEPLLMYSFPTVNKDSISVTKESDGSLTVARLAQVTQPDTLATNGVVHEVSRLLEF